MDIRLWTILRGLTWKIFAGLITCVTAEHVFPDVDAPVPEFIPSPSNVTFHLGELAILKCSVFNLGMRTVVWRRTESSFPLTSGTMTVIADPRFQISHVSYKSQWDLMIKNVEFEDEGLYECQVASIDKNIRKVVALTVIGKDPEEDLPEIHISEPQYVERGERIHLQCNATGEYYAPDEMDWFRNGERLTSRRNEGVKIFKSYSIAKRTFFSELKIHRATMLDDGTYVCRSSNNQITSTKVHVLNAETFNKKRENIIRVSNRLDPDEAPSYSAPHLDPNCLQRYFRRTKEPIVCQTYRPQFSGAYEM